MMKAPLIVPQGLDPSGVQLTYLRLAVKDEKQKLWFHFSINYFRQTKRIKIYEELMRTFFSEAGGGGGKTQYQSAVWP